MTDTTASNVSHQALIENWPKLDDDQFLDVIKGADHAEWRMAKNGFWYFYRSHQVTWGTPPSYEHSGNDIRRLVSFSRLNLYPKLRASTMILRPNGNIQVMLIGQRPVAKQSTGGVVFPCKSFFYVLKPMIHKIKAHSGHRRICYQVFSKRARKLQLLTLNYHPCDWGTYDNATVLFHNRKLGWESLVASAFPDDWFPRKPVWAAAPITMDGHQLCFDGLGRERNF